MCRQNHGIAVDYFAVGVMAFECMFGRVMTLGLYTVIETLCGKVKKRNKRPYPIKADTNKAQ
jgi:hypothetical protein